MHHINFSDVARHLARYGWGKKFDSMDAALSAVGNDKGEALTSYVGLALLESLGAIGEALSPLRKSRNHPKLFMPKTPFVGEDVQIGDRLYCYNLDDGLKEWVVVGKDDANHCMAAEVEGSFDLENGPATTIADHMFYRTKEAAMEAEMREQYEFWEQRKGYFEGMKEAIKAGNVDAYASGLEI